MLAGLFFFRFHILTALFLAIFPVLAQEGRAVALLGGLIVLEDWFAIVLVTYLAFLVSWVVMVTTVLTWTYGFHQFGVMLAPPPSWFLRYRLPLFSLLAAPTLVAVGRLSPCPWGVKVLSMAGGVAAALLTIAVASGLRRLFTDRTTPIESLFFGTTGALGHRLQGMAALGPAQQAGPRQAAQ
ncbi:MAG: hypothetical protein ACREJG_04310, partial [Candidatus Rokuibacteriota bacterium]